MNDAVFFAVVWRVKLEYQINELIAREISISTKSMRDTGYIFKRSHKIYAYKLLINNKKFRYILVAESSTLKLEYKP